MEGWEGGGWGGRAVKVLLLQLDGSLPNIALMRISAHHRALGDECELRYATTERRACRRIGDYFGKVYASAIFEKTRDVVDAVRAQWPDALIGGTGVNVADTLEAHGITTTAQDYSLYPACRTSIGFSQRGCRLRCGFCVVPTKEGAVSEAQTINEIWRGDPWPRDIVLMDNDFFGQPRWRERIDEMRAGKFRVSFNQGINARMLNAETAAAIASVDYRDDSFTRKRIYTAWDSKGDERRLFRGLELLAANGVKPDHIMVYILIGYWPGETHMDREYRSAKLRAFGARPYPMPFTRSRELVGFQRWVIGAYDKRITWSDWAVAGYEPRRLGGVAIDAESGSLFEDEAPTPLSQTNAVYPY